MGPLARTWLGLGVQGSRARVHGLAGFGLHFVAAQMHPPTPPHPTPPHLGCSGISRHSCRLVGLIQNLGHHWVGATMRWHGAERRQHARWAMGQRRLLCAGVWCEVCVMRCVSVCVCVCAWLCGRGLQCFTHLLSTTYCSMNVRQNGHLTPLSACIARPRLLAWHAGVPHKQ